MYYYAKRDWTPSRTSSRRSNQPQVRLRPKSKPTRTHRHHRRVVDEDEATTALSIKGQNYATAPQGR